MQHIYFSDLTDQGCWRLSNQEMSAYAHLNRSENIKALEICVDAFFDIQYSLQMIGKRQAEDRPR